MTGMTLHIERFNVKKTILSLSQQGWYDIIMYYCPQRVKQG